MHSRRTCAAAFLLLAAAPLLFSWDISSRYTIQWDTGRVYLDITAYREAEDPSFPAARAQAEHAIERMLPLLCLDAAAEIPADSRRTLGDIMEEDKGVLASLRDLYLRAAREPGTFTEDLSGLKVRYSFRLYPDLVESLIRHDRPFKIERRLDWEPAGPFTGIVIYARGELPEYGKDSAARLEPCLLPSIHDSEMNLLAAPYMIHPDTLRSAGPVTYVYSLTDKRVLDRTGYYPMRVAARGVFGTRPTDPVLPLEWGDKIRASRHIQKLIADGRVVIVIDPPEISRPASDGP